MTTIIGVRFRKSGKVYYFDPEDKIVNKGDHVIVETARGVEYGLVVLPPKEMPEERIVKPLKPIIRLATPEDDITNQNNEIEEKEAYDICLEKIREHELDMKLIDSEYTFDRNKLLFYFTADGRVDFRELVKDLASVFRTRIELRQIGVRDETKMIGGVAICGRPLCCHTFLADFAPVSIKMAKEQNLSLNPTKISGSCGRLMCCLKNEEEAYEYLNKTLPHVGDNVTTYDGYQGVVKSVSVLKQKVKAIIFKKNDEKEIREYKVDELRFESHNRQTRGPVGQALPDEELDENALKELEQLEKKDLEEVTDEAEQKPKSNKNHQGRRRGNNRNNHRGDTRNKGEQRNDKNSKNNSQQDGVGGGRRENRENRKNRKNPQEHHQNDYQKKQGDSPSEEQGGSRNENRGQKTRYRNSHNSHKGNRNRRR